MIMNKIILMLVVILTMGCSDRSSYCNTIQVVYNDNSIDTLTVKYDMNEYDKKPYLRLYVDQCQVCVGYSTAAGANQSYVVCNVKRFNILDSCETTK